MSQLNDLEIIKWYYTFPSQPSEKLFTTKRCVHLALFTMLQKHSSATGFLKLWATEQLLMVHAWYHWNWVLQFEPLNQLVFNLLLLPIIATHYNKMAPIYNSKKADVLHLCT